jgi:hypothetical protein
LPQIDDEDKPMSAINKEKSNPLSSRQDVVAALNTLLGALDTQFPAGHSRFSLGIPVRITPRISRRWRGFPARCGGYFR